ncbi:MAG: flagellar biosynthesis protein FliQ [Alphaproteobacteria bacterium]|jgi:flagellar biosynthetic protein FliQ|nr:flagellar biosynthesis protein FliQ [Alphaproteobacteria bacterium]
MNIGDFLDISRDGIGVLLLTVGPLMLISLTVGLSIALFQALTQIQEMTLTFVPKILVTFLSLLVLLPYMISQVTGFMERISQMIINGA